MKNTNRKFLILGTASMLLLVLGTWMICTFSILWNTFDLEALIKPTQRFVIIFPVPNCLTGSP